MPTTTNYGWTTPADTDLVKDGAAAIRTLGSSIDTSVKSLNAGTTAGDIDYYTSATAKARIGIGSSGQVLAVSGGVPAWTTVSSGGMTLISTTALSGASVVLSSIPQTYINLVLVLKGVNNDTTGYRPSVTPNAGTCNVITIFPTNTTVNSESNAAIRLHQYASGAGWATGQTNNNLCIFINNYTDTASSKPLQYYGRIGIASSTTQIFGTGSIQGTTAISSLTIATDVGTFSAGSALLYGVK